VELAPRLAAARLVLVITAGEEVGCEGARFLADRRLLDRAGAIVVAVPTANYPYVGHKGLAWLSGRDARRDGPRLHCPEWATTRS